MPENQHGSNPPPGWYPDPNGSGQRYWDGQQWTEHTHAAAPQTPQPPAAPAAPQPPQAPPVPQAPQAPPVPQAPQAPGAAQPGGQPMPAAAQSRAGEPATAGIRFGARLLDGIILGVPFWIVLLAIGVDFAGGVGESFLVGILGTALYLAYFVYMESTRGQTLGKQVLKLRTVGPQGGNPTTQQALVRSVWTAVGIVPFIGGFASLGIAIWIAVSIGSDPYRRGVHDKWAEGTAVLRTA